MTYPPQPGPYGQQPGPYGPPSGPQQQPPPYGQQGQYGQPGPYGQGWQQPGPFAAYPGDAGGIPPKKSKTGLIVTLCVVAVLLIGGAVTLVLVLGGDDDTSQVNALADRYAKTLSAGNAQELAKITCDAPTPSQITAFGRVYRRAPATFTVSKQPTVNGDRASLTLRGDDGKHQQEFSATLLKKDDKWCASYDWSKVE